MWDVAPREFDPQARTEIGRAGGKNCRYGSGRGFMRFNNDGAIDSPLRVRGGGEGRGGFRDRQADRQTGTEGGKEGG